MSRTYRVAFAEIEPLGLLAVEQPLFEAAFRESWRPGAQVVRYGRQWRVSAPHDVENATSVLTGRIGYVREDEIATLEFDEEAMDFRRGAAPSGAVIPFAVDVEQRRVGFQLVPGQVRTASFTGALESVLNLSATYRWRVRPLVRKVSFEVWRRSVDRVTEFNFRLERPNPHYADDDKVEEIIEDFNAEVVRVSGKGEDVDEGADLFRQALDHTLNRHYGRAVVRGLRDEHETEWRTTDDGTVPAIERVESENEEELPEEELVPLLETVEDVIASDDVGEDEFPAS